MSFVFFCPYCNQKIQCENEDDGTQAPCPACHRMINVRSNFSYAAPPPPAAPHPPAAPASRVPEPAGAAEYTPPAHRPPVLAIIFTIIAVIDYLIAFGFLMFLLHLLINKGRNFDYFTMLGIAGGGTFFFFWTGLFAHGIAQFFCYVGRIAENSSAIRRLLELDPHRRG